uniref:Uncharacterized protein n=1 Tax=Phlebotomus papatasi TaxID=29031 RepID=A0A1B0D043_PHLPP
MKNQAKKSPFFRQYICMPPAQCNNSANLQTFQFVSLLFSLFLSVYNWWEVKAKMWSMDLGKPTTVQPLNEAMAIELGANLLGEVIHFCNWRRQVKKENKNQETMLQEKLELNLKLQELQFQAERQDAQIRELMRILADVESRTWLPKKPFKKSETSPILKTMENRRNLREFETENVRGKCSQLPLYPSIVHRALELVEKEVFSGDDIEDEETQKLGRISQALVHLRYQ